MFSAAPIFIGAAKTAGYGLSAWAAKQAYNTLKADTKKEISKAVRSVYKGKKMVRRSNKRRSYSSKKKVLRKRKRKRVKRGTGCFKVSTHRQKIFNRLPGFKHPKTANVRFRSVFVTVMEPQAFQLGELANETIIHMNNPHKPNALVAGSKCYGFDEYAALYGRYRPMASAIRVTPINNDNPIEGNGGKLTPWYGIREYQNGTDSAFQSTVFGLTTELVHYMDNNVITKWRELSAERAGTKSNVLTACWKDQKTRHLLALEDEDMWLQTGSAAGETLETPTDQQRHYQARVWLGSPISHLQGTNSRGHAFLVEYECQVAFKEPVSDVVPS